MLLQFSVENFLSFREPQVLSMLAAEGVDHPPHTVMEGPEGKKVLRCAGIYGANASGKSNLIKALEFATNLVLKGTRPSEPLARRPFRLDATSEQNPTCLQWEVCANDVRYSYGIELSSTAILSEWLFVHDGANEARIFERDGDHIEFGDALALNPERTLFFRFLAEGTRKNQPFLAEARERNAREIEPVWRAFEGQQFVRPDRPFAPLVDFFRTHPDFHKFAGDILSNAATGVDEINLYDSPVGIPDQMKSLLDLTPGEMRPAVVGLFNAFFQETAAGAIQVIEKGAAALLTIRVRPDGAPVVFAFNEESDGTQRLVHLAPALYLIEKSPSGILLAIDELERSLHPLLTRAFLQRFFASSNQSQLLFTTHDTNLLDLTLLSRDAIWFTEKDPAGATVLYSLAEYKQDQIAELGPQLEKGYLQGRFGAIPFLGDASRLGWKKAAE